MFKRQTNDKFLEIKQEIEQVYLLDDIPWIIGYSGGKDSTVMLQLVTEVLVNLAGQKKAKKHVYVISSDTLVENPVVINKTKKSIKNINEFSKNNNLPLSAQLIYPKINNTFFVNLIGRGYPVPLQAFRWCTDRIKISPANDFILNKVAENGEVVLLLGTREEESISRKRSMDKHKIKGSILSSHGSIKNAWTYPVIANLSVNDVWDYLLKNKNPWGDDNEDLYALYRESTLDGECPIVIDQSTKNQQTCGNSRFGCWTCTVVKTDKSLTGFIESGNTWLKPFLNYRDDLVKNRDIQENRKLFDKNGNLKLVEVFIKNNEIIIPSKLERKEKRYSLNSKKIMSKEKAIEEIKKTSEKDVDNLIIKKYDKYYRIGRSGYTYEHKQKMLHELFKVEKNIQKKLPEYKIILKDEIIEINNIWKKNGEIEISAIEIYNKYHQDELLDEEYSNINFQVLNKLCEEYKFNQDTLNQIINNTKLTINLDNRNSNVKFINNKLTEHKLLIKG